MKERISIREAATEAEINSFWRELDAYHDRDIFPKAGSTEREYFHSTEYREAIQAAHDRENDRCYYLLFSRGDLNIGFALTSLYTGEDGKFFILEFCVLPEYRGGGTGHDCAVALLDWAKERGMMYAELNCAEPRRIRFWQSLGFTVNGVDEWGEPLMLLPPADKLPFTVKIADKVDWQLLRLQNGYHVEIGEEPLDAPYQERLRAAVDEGRITFLILMRGFRCIGMCSIAPVFSSFECMNVGVFEDFYIEPVFRKSGGARLLTDAAHRFGLEHGYSDLTVTCAPCDEAMYQALGFTTRLGSVYADI